MLEHALKYQVVTGTCFEYGMQSGILSKDMGVKSNNAYSMEKDILRNNLTNAGASHIIDDFAELKMIVSSSK